MALSPRVNYTDFIFCLSAYGSYNRYSVAVGRYQGRCQNTEHSCDRDWCEIAVPTALTIKTVCQERTLRTAADMHQRDQPPPSSGHHLATCHITEGNIGRNPNLSSPFTYHSFISVTGKFSWWVYQDILTALGTRLRHCE
jgi:hypothetical protein